MTPQGIQTILDENFAPWVKALDIETLETAQDYSLFRMPLRDHLARVGGIVSGQALAALADTTMVLAAIARAGELKLYATTNLDTQFLRPGVGSAILCKAMIVRSGKALLFARAEMSEETSGKLIATANATLYAP
ncbi:PaaI family thioesterase [Aestuariivita boseongensis]|uniref:PaaI family thioesterase n=1 Tax=Aestuariivita boseongensis TaxID=1470562 RepID=UPI000681DFC4|nr:PaaI family thioesterase [Aestuariivita boseongensis]